METDIFYDINKLFDQALLLVTSMGRNLDRDVSPFETAIRNLQRNFNLQSVDHMFDMDFKSYRDHVQSENFLMDLNLVVNQMARELPVDLNPIQSAIFTAEIAKLYDIVADQPIPNAPDINASRCEECGRIMDVHEETSEYRCDNCGLIVSILGAVFRDEQIYNQDGIRTRSANNITYRHYRGWMDHIQGKEFFEPDEKSLANIRAVMARDGIFKGDLNCEIMRRILADPVVNRTNWNEHATHLIHDVGGPQAPILTFEEDRMISIKFAKAVELYSKAADETAQYKSYYPDLIRRIIEVDFAKIPEKLRLVKYIHIQQRKTTIKNDLVFQKICEMAKKEDGLVYVPTDPDRRKFNAL